MMNVVFNKTLCKEKKYGRKKGNKRAVKLKVGSQKSKQLSQLYTLLVIKWSHFPRYGQTSDFGA